MPYNLKVHESIVEPLKLILTKQDVSFILHGTMFEVPTNGESDAFALGRYYEQAKSKIEKENERAIGSGKKEQV